MFLRSLSCQYTQLVSGVRRLPAAAGSEMIASHPALHSARHDAPALPSHDFRAQLDENLVACVSVPREVLRGEWPSHGATCGG